MDPARLCGPAEIMPGRKAILYRRGRQGTLAPFQKSEEMLRCLYYVRRWNVKGGLVELFRLWKDEVSFRPVVRPAVRARKRLPRAALDGGDNRGPTPLSCQLRAQVGAQQAYFSDQPAGGGWPRYLTQKSFCDSTGSTGAQASATFTRTFKQCSWALNQ